MGATPVVASILVGVAVGRLLPQPSGLLGSTGWWAAVLVTSTASLLVVDRVARRALPLATLLQLSMLFPDRAPSRFAMARRVAGTRAIAAELEEARQHGVTGDRQEAAETVLALVGALGDYDSRTRGHSERTQLYVSMLAEQMDLEPEDAGKLVWAALIHDIGKLRVPVEILNKAGRPTEEEWAQLKLHPEHGAEICEPLREWLGPWYDAIEQHHERWDGGGYPHGLAADRISLSARVVSVADSYEVMTAHRPYKTPMTAEAARRELTRCAGTQFDPQVVRAFLALSLGRLRWVAGPLSWLGQLPFLGQLPSFGNVVSVATGAVSSTVTTAAAAGAAVVVLGASPLVAAPAAADEQVAPPAVVQPSSTSAQRLAEDGREVQEPAATGTAAAAAVPADPAPAAVGPSVETAAAGPVEPTAAPSASEEPVGAAPSARATRSTTAPPPAATPAPAQPAAKPAPAPPAAKPAPAPAPPAQQPAPAPAPPSPSAAPPPPPPVAKPPSPPEEDESKGKGKGNSKGKGKGGSGDDDDDDDEDDDDDDD